jgi:hypothetical protein
MWGRHILHCHHRTGLFPQGSPTLHRASPPKEEAQSYLNVEDAVPGKPLRNRAPLLEIHCFAFDRPEHFQRLWTSLTAAKPTILQVHIVVHVDYDNSNSSGWQRQVAFVTGIANTQTRHGPVSAIFATENRGLRATMLEAWAPLPGQYAMFLEDDIEVSEMILVYSERFIQTYGEVERPDRSILGFKLYNQKWDEVNMRYERPVMNNFQPFKIQEPCSWGTVFLAEPYSRYLAWFVRNNRKDPYVPRAWSNTWDAARSAKKYLQRYMWEEGLALISINLPDYLSLTTPHVDAEGTNIKQQWLGFLKDRLEVPLITMGTSAAAQSAACSPKVAHGLVVLQRTSHACRTADTTPL